MILKRDSNEDGNFDTTETYSLGDSITTNGIYQLTLTDHSSNSTVVRFTIDRNSPSLSSFTMRSNNQSESLIAKEGEVVTYAFQADEKVSVTNVRAYINNSLIANPVSIDNAGDTDDSTWNVKLTVESTNENGDVDFRFVLTDEVGNESKINTSLTPQDKVKIDTTSPTLLNVTLDPNNAYMDMTFSEGVYGGTDGSLIDKSYFTAVINDGTSDGSPTAGSFTPKTEQNY